MPVVEPWYNPNYDPGTPIIKVFWDNFIGARSDVNQQIMRERLQSQSPEDLGRLRRQIEGDIVDLEEQKQKLHTAMAVSSTSQDKAASQRDIEILRAGTKILVANTNAAARLGAAEIYEKGDQIKLMVENAVDRTAGFDQGAGAGKQGAAFVNEAVQTGADEVDAYRRAAGAAVGQGKGKTEFTVGAAGALYDNAMANGHYNAAEFLRQQYLTGAESGETSRDYARRAFMIMDADEIDERAAEVSRSKGAGYEPGSALDTLMGAAGITVSDRDAVRAEVEAAVPSGGYDTTTEVATRGASPALEPLKEAIRQKDLAIEAKEKRLAELEGRGGGSRGAMSGFQGNALLNTQFIAPPPRYREREEMIRQFSNDDVRDMTAMMDEAGGDIDKALEIARARLATAKKPAIEPEVMAPPEEPPIVEEAPLVTLIDRENEEPVVEPEVKPVAETESAKPTTERVTTKPSAPPVAPPRQKEPTVAPAAPPSRPPPVAAAPAPAAPVVEESVAPVGPLPTRQVAKKPATGVVTPEATDRDFDVVDRYRQLGRQIESLTSMGASEEVIKGIVATEAEMRSLQAEAEASARRLKVPLTEQRPAPAVAPKTLELPPVEVTARPSDDQIKMAKMAVGIWARKNAELQAARNKYSGGQPASAQEALKEIGKINQQLKAMQSDYDEAQKILANQ